MAQRTMLCLACDPGPARARLGMNSTVPDTASVWQRAVEVALARIGTHSTMPGTASAWQRAAEVAPAVTTFI